ncbi:pitrilysin family protein [Clostridium sp.]|uniref:M16 family metallopeptidase n=1 Tax=Clostridium sp. TaxID=1506 RepID=UPI002FCC9415
MKKTVLKNGMKIIYERIPGSITSFTLGLEAGANVESHREFGLAHVVEHMVFKGTKSKTEREINNICDEVFGFHNAMTNYPYVVYYGTCLNEDFQTALEVYSDIIINPTFSELGFKEEINVIIEELKEWSEDLVQHCEDILFFNAFKERRIKELIIGTEDLLRSFTTKDVTNFYNKYYMPSNTVISVVTSLAFEEIIKEVEKQFNSWGTNEIKAQEQFKLVDKLHSENRFVSESEINTNLTNKITPLYEDVISKKFIKEISNINGAKIQYIFPIHQLSEREIALLRIFNEAFGEGTSSILYDEIRTNKGLVYDVSGKIKNEKEIKLYTITLGTSKENVEDVLRIIDEKINEVNKETKLFSLKNINKFVKSQKLKRTLTLEKSIVLSMNMAVYEIMYKNSDLLFNEFELIKDVTEEELLGVVSKVLVNPAVQLIIPMDK